MKKAKQKESDVGFNLKSKFTGEFFEEFQFYAEFRSIFESMTRGLTPYEAIEHITPKQKAF